MESSVAFSRGPGPEEVILILSMVFMVFMVFIGLVVTAITVFCFCRIFSKAGYSWAFGLLMLLPMAGIVIPLILAIMEWPVSRELRLFKQGQSGSSK